MFDFDFDMGELDATALGIALLLVAIVLGSMFGVLPSMGGWSTVPWWMKVAFGVFVGPMTYFIVVWQRNR